MLLSKPIDIPDPLESSFLTDCLPKKKSSILKLPHIESRNKQAFEAPYQSVRVEGKVNRTYAEKPKLLIYRTMSEAIEVVDEKK